MNGQLKHYRILQVEDDSRLASEVANFLSPHGFEVSIEGCGNTAVKRIIHEDPDAVIMEIDLPGLDGFSLCQAVRSTYRGLIVMLTARGDEIDEVVGLEVGADDFLTKPVRSRALLARLQARLRRRPLKHGQTPFELAR